MTLWDAYLLLLHRLHLGPYPFPLPIEEGGAAGELSDLEWFPAAEGARFENTWRWAGTPLAFLFALAGQLSLAAQLPWLGAIALLTGAGILVGEMWRLKLNGQPASIASAAAPAIRAEAVPLPGFAAPAIAYTDIRWRYVFLGYIASALTFLLAGHNDLNPFALLGWMVSLGLWLAAFWEGPLPFHPQRWVSFLRRFAEPAFKLHFSRTLALFLAVLVVSAWFRFSQLNEVPIALTSDHVEKLNDVSDILNNGKRPIFEPGNGGREPLAFYLAALTANWAGTGLSYLTLKLVMAVAGFLTLPFIFLLAREAAEDDLTALLAMLVAGIGWWPNVISRNGLRFPFAMLFAAIALWLIVRALRRDRRNDVLLAGLAVGLGLYGYTPVRVAPLAIGLAVGLYALYRRRKSISIKLLAWLAMFSMIVLTAFIPMFRYAVDEPENFWRRTFTRLTGEPGLETARLNWQALSCAEDRSIPVPQSGLEKTVLTGWVFLCNEWDSVRMFSWTSDAAWLVSPANQPALDWVMGALFFLGVAALIYRYLRYRNWIDLFLLLAIPVLLLPSTLALAFPLENPSLHRSGAAIPIVFIIVVAPLRLFIDYGRKVWPGWGGKALGAGVVGLLLLISALENWNILFVRYANQYKSSVQNSAELGEIVRGWAESMGDWETVVVKAYPHWVDTRAVGIYAGRLGWNNVALELDELGKLKDDPRPKLYLLHRDDQEAVDFLRRLYPQGTLTYRSSEYHQKDFLTFFAPGEEDLDERLLPTP